MKLFLTTDAERTCATRHDYEVAERTTSSLVLYCLDCGSIVAYGSAVRDIMAAIDAEELGEDAGRDPEAEEEDRGGTALN